MANGQDVLHDFSRASALEWLLTDGSGGYAAGTASGAPSRRSHALLAAASPHGALTALLLRFEEKLVVHGVAHELSASFATARDGGGLQSRPGALAELEWFDPEPFPVWRWRFEDVRIERSLRLIEGHHALIASWRLLSAGEVRLSVAPLLTARAPLAVLRESAAFRGAASGIPGRVRIETLPDAPGVTLWHNGSFMPARGWVKGLAYPLDTLDTNELTNGHGDGGDAPPHGAGGAALHPMEDAAFLPGWVQAQLAEPGAALHVVVSPEEGLFRSLATAGRLGTPPAQTLHDCVAALEQQTRDRQSAWRKRSLAGADLTARQAASSHGGAGEALARRSEPLIDEHDALARALSADLLDGLVRRRGRVTLATAWPDGAELGAETLRAATALVTLRAFEPARAIARGYLEYLDEGLAPERFDPVDGMPRYGDPEPSLWLVHLVDLIARRTGAPADDPFLLKEAWPALEGVLHHLRSGSRRGVGCDRDGLLWSGEGANARARADLNALWYHALVAMAQLGKLLGRRENAAFYLAWAHELQRRYTERFWDEEAGALFVALSPTGATRGISPRQLWAASMAPPLLSPEHSRRLVATIEAELFAVDTPPADSQAWLGTWAAAALRAEGREDATLARVRARFAGLERSIRAQGRLPAASSRRLRPVLSSAELLRAWVEEVERSEVSVLAS